MSASIRLAPHAFLISLAVPLVAGAVIGFVVRGAVERPVDVPEDALQVEAPKSVPDMAQQDAALAVAKANEESLKARVAELERLLNEREGNLARLASKAEEARETPDVKPNGEAGDAARQQRPRESFRDRMERMKRDEPERYAEMQKRQEEFRARMRAANEERDTYLASVDTSRMSAEQKSAHERLLTALRTRDAYMERMRPDAENPLTEEERQEAFAAMRDIGPLMDQERHYLLEETGRAYGEEGAAFADYIQDIFDNTSPGPRMGRGRGQRPWGGSPGGAPGGGPQ